MNIFKIYIVVLIFFLSKVNAISMANIQDEATLITCQTLGHSLYLSCVVIPPTEPKQIAACTAIKLSYDVCLQKITSPYPLTVSVDPDSNSHNPFTPCHYETGHMILFDICPSLPI
jgi:hypothetical protein